MQGSKYSPLSNVYHPESGAAQASAAMGAYVNPLTVRQVDDFPAFHLSRPLTPAAGRLSTKPLSTPLFTGVGYRRQDGCRCMAAFASLGSQTAALIPPGKAHLRETTQDAARSLETFLASVERKAFRIAQIALRHEADALDVVQDAMMQLSSRYATRPAEEWKPLFYRILENRVRDVQRRRSVRNRVMSYLPWRTEDEEAAIDPIEQAVDKAPLPPEQLQSDEAMAALEQAIAGLPARQRQAFLLRNFEGLDVAETAASMKCSQGSVKTHYFRAVQALRSKLGDFRT
jgi:RNA polymerase sigma-70 factor, ECF subfamily